MTLLSRLRCSLLAALLFCASPSPTDAQEADTQDSIISIGVLAFRGTQKAHLRWDAIANYLSQQISGHRFEIRAYDLEGMDRAVSDKQIDFVLTNPGNYVRLETLFGATRITTLSNLYKGKSYTIFGAVIFTHAKNTNISTLQDLRGHSFAAVDKQAFGGFQMAWYEFDRRGINPFTDFKEISFKGFPQDLTVMAVINGAADAGTVRAETLQRMIDEKKINLQDIRILNPRYVNDYPFIHSTRLYPEWAFAKLKHAEESLAQQVAVALLTQQSGSIASVASNINGWTIPLDYSRVHDTFRKLRIEPYANIGEITLANVWNIYGHWIMLAFFILGLLAVTTIYVGRINHRLTLSRVALEKEIEERKQAELKLARHSDLLEETVQQRTNELRAVNLALEQDIQARKEVEEALRSSDLALRRLYEITSATDANFNQKITLLLDFGASYFHLPTASFLKKEQQGFVPVQRIPKRAVSPQQLPEDAPSPESTGEQALFCYGIPVLVHEKMYGALCFIGNATATQTLSSVDQDILQLMAQWIGGEVERKEAEDKALQHQRELAHVSRLGTMGEMASGLAHELNQPLTAIANYTRGCIRRLRGKNPDLQEIVKAIDHSASEAERAAKIINRLRDFVSKGETSKKAVNINDIIHMVVEISEADISRHQIDLRLHLARQLPSIIADHIQLEQVVLNLLRNSMESLQQQTARRRIDITSAEEQGHIVVTVEDNGAGIAPDALGHLFHPFFTTKKQGMGLGLSISRSIIEAHGGQLQILPHADGANCSFQFMIPVDTDNMPAYE